jgi:hypothetical protein
MKKLLAVLGLAFVMVFTVNAMSHDGGKNCKHGKKECSAKCQKKCEAGKSKCCTAEEAAKAKAEGRSCCTKGEEAKKACCAGKAADGTAPKKCEGHAH